MEKQRVCKICSKRFSNGKAMGGHMRSHLVKLPVPPKPLAPQQRAISAEYSPAGAHSDLSVQDRESDTDSRPTNPTRRCRTKRRREDLWDTSVEDVALCLLMMSRDIWRRENPKEALFDDEEEEEGYEEDDEDDEDEDESESFGKFRCKTCNKGFRSYQALGGHKASHKKISHLNAGEDEFCKLGVHQRVFECPFCPKVFDSGQALGGHKKVHLSHLKNSCPPKFGNSSIDLNRPAPEYDDDDDEDEEEDEISQFSAISHPIKFVQTHPR